MASSETDIGNGALLKLGERPVLTFDDDNDRARLLKAMFADVRDDELRSHRWHFAMKRAQLSALSAAPTFGFDLQYTIPSDCLRMVEIEGQDVLFSLQDARGPGGSSFALEGGKILTNLSAPLNVRYVKRETSIAMFDPCFAEALKCRLAMEVCEPLTQSEGKRRQAERGYNTAIMKARRMNAIETPPEAPGDDSWVVGRL